MSFWLHYPSHGGLTVEPFSDMMVNSQVSEVSLKREYTFGTWKRTWFCLNAITLSMKFMNTVKPSWNKCQKWYRVWDIGETLERFISTQMKRYCSKWIYKKRYYSDASRIHTYFLMKNYLFLHNRMTSKGIFSQNVFTPYYGNSCSECYQVSLRMDMHFLSN